ncbi:MAG: NRDE family protein, partial [Myxococcales bacterium]|nr:NRDE family protein [Myxococcales bacterium]
RDENLARPAEGPRVWPAGELATRRVLAPRDLVAGGTWIGLNDAGLAVAITNRRAGPWRTKAPRSRGELVFAALGADDHLQAVARITAEHGEVRHYGPYHLLMADRSGATILWSDGRRLHRESLAPGLHWITERSFDAAASKRHDRLRSFESQLLGGPLPDPGRWTAILADHHHGALIDHPLAGLDAMCVHAPSLDYGTRSSTLIALGERREQVEFLHADGRPCEHPLVPRPTEVSTLLAP